MDCEKCQSLLSDFLDGTLTENDRVWLNTHLTDCLHCLSARQELSSIITVAHECRGTYIAPANARAMWIRISNAIESENQKINPTAISKARETVSPRFLNRRWELSFGQLAAVVASVILIATLGTIFGLRGLQSTNNGATMANADALNASNSRIKDNNPATDRFAAQRMAVEYWQQRVEQRKARWSPQMRETFERNIGAIDQAVNDSMHDLDKNPHDEVTEEMLNDAMRGKIELLKDFSEL